jgi:hypothetical protein
MRSSESEIDAIVERDMALNNGDCDATYELIATIDHAFHSGEADFNGGLSLFDRLHNKLSRYYNITWEPQTVREIIATYGPDLFMPMLRELITVEMLNCYGI